MPVLWSSLGANDGFWRSLTRWIANPKPLLQGTVAHVRGILRSLLRAPRAQRDDLLRCARRHGVARAVVARVARGEDDAAPLLVFVSGAVLMDRSSDCAAEWASQQLVASLAGRVLNGAAPSSATPGCVCDALVAILRGRSPSAPRRLLLSMIGEFEEAQPGQEASTIAEALVVAPAGCETDPAGCLRALPLRALPSDVAEATLELGLVHARAHVPGNGRARGVRRTCPERGRHRYPCHLWGRARRVSGGSGVSKYAGAIAPSSVCLWVVGGCG